MQERRYTLRQVKEMTDISIPTLRKAIDKGWLIAHQPNPGGKLFIEESDLKAYLARRRQRRTKT